MTDFTVTYNEERGLMNFDANGASAPITVDDALVLAKMLTEVANKHKPKGRYKDNNTGDAQ